MMFTFLATVKYKMTIGEGLCSTADFLWAKQRWWWWWWHIWMFHFLVSRFKILHRGSVLLSYCLLPNSPRSTHSRKSENIQTQTGNFPCNFGLITQINKRTVNQHLSVWKNLQHSLKNFSHVVHPRTASARAQGVGARAHGAARCRQGGAAVASARDVTSRHF